MDGRSRELLIEQVREAIRANLTPEEAGEDAKVEPEVKNSILPNGGSVCSDA